MKPTFSIIFFLFFFTATGQVTRVSVSSVTTNPVVYTQAGTDTLINRLNRAITTLQSQVRLLQSQAIRDSANIAALQSSVAALQKQVSGDTLFFDSYFTVANKTVSLNIDSVAKKLPQVNLKPINDTLTNYGTYIKALQTGQANLRKGLDANTANDAILKAWADKVKLISFNL